MAIDFPNGATAGQRFQVNNRIWVYNGSTWDTENSYQNYGHGSSHAAAGSDPVAISVSQVSGAAPLASPALTGVPTAPTAISGSSDTTIATTAFVSNATSAASIHPFLLMGA